MKKFLLYIFIGLILGIVFIILSENSETATPKTSTTNIQKSSYLTTKGGDFAAISEDIYNDLLNLVAVKDMVAINELQESGKVIILKEGLKVKVVSRTMGMVKIRLKGTNTVVWTAVEAVH